GTSGDSGPAAGHPHLHFEVRRNDHLAVDPYGYQGQDMLWMTGPDRTAPTVCRFGVRPSLLPVGNDFTISYSVGDMGGSGLKRVELWRTIDDHGQPASWDD